MEIDEKLQITSGNYWIVGLDGVHKALLLPYLVGR